MDNKQNDGSQKALQPLPSSSLNQEQVVGDIREAFQKVMLPINIIISPTTINNTINNTEIKVENSEVGTMVAGGKVALEPSFNENICEGFKQKREKRNVNENGSNLSNEPHAVIEVLRSLSDFDEGHINISDTETDNIPIVHPRIVKVEFYKNCQVSETEEYKPSNQKPVRKSEIIYGKEIHFEHLLGDHYRSKYIGLLGFPGSGKTVLSKRLAKATKLNCFYIRFMDINYEHDFKITLRELLLDNMFPNLSELECIEAFDWIVKNDQQCAIIIDGYDQAEWVMTKNPPKVSLNTKMCINDLVANLCMKHFLPGSTLIITSRPHSMITLPLELRPQITIMLQDFTFDEMKKLFFALAGTSAESLWQKLNANAPHLLSFCQNPLMLRFVLRASLNPHDDVVDIKTMTNAFTSVLEELRYSSHTHHDDIHKITKQLSRIAFCRTECYSVVITTKDLATENLSISAVQDLIIAMYGGKRGGSKVFDGDTKLFFSHQMLQEYFSASYIAKEMPLAEFKTFVRNDLFRPHWDVVRRFLCGLLIGAEPDPRKSSSSKKNLTGWLLLRRSDEEEKKRNHLISKMAEMLKYQFSELQNKGAIAINANNYPGKFWKTKRRCITFYGDLRECANDELALKAAELSSSRLMCRSFSLSSSDCHAIGFILKKIKKKMIWLKLPNCDMNDRCFSYIASAIREMPGNIGLLHIAYNSFSSKIVSMICSILPKVDRIDLQNCIKVEGEYERRNLNEEEQNMLQDALNNVQNNAGKTILVDVENVKILKALKQNHSHSAKETPANSKS